MLNTIKKKLVSVNTKDQIKHSYHSSHSNFFAGNPVNQFYKVKLTPNLSKALKVADELKEEIEVQQSKANGNLKKAIQDKLRYAWTYNSNAIEGNQLTLGDTIFFLQEGLTVSGKPLKDFLDAQNHSEAIDYLSGVVQGDLPIDTHLLRSINQILLKHVDYIFGKDALGKPIQKKMYAGEYKKEPNYVLQMDGTIHTYVEPFDVSPQMEDLCKWIDAKLNKQHPIITASVAHYNHVRIHPFQDGNGRGSRILMNLILMRQHFTPAIIEVSKRREYLSCLKAADKGDLIPFTEFAIDSVNQTQRVVLEAINEYLGKNEPSGIKPKC